MERCMNQNDIVVFGKWLGDGYLESFAIVRDINPASIDLRYGVNGEALYESDVRLDHDAIEGQDYYRESIPIDFTDQSPVSGQVVWVSYASEEANSRIYQGVVLSSPEAFGSMEKSLRVAFSHRTRTLLPQSQATACDSFWSVEQSAPVYCDDD